MSRPTTSWTRSGGARRGSRAPSPWGAWAGGGGVLAWEPAALDILGADVVREVEPGEMVVLGEPGGPRSVRYAEGREHLCVFELIYFARPDSYMLRRRLHEARPRGGGEA